MKQIHYIIAITAAALLAACDKEAASLSGESTGGRTAVREVSLTRAAENGTVPPDGRYGKLTIYAYEGTTVTADNSAAFIYENEVWKQDGALLVPKQDANFIGVTGTETPFAFALSEKAKDQSTPEGMLAADFMTTDRTPLGANNSLSLNFKHRLSQVSVNITEYGTEFGGATPAINDVTFHSAASVTLDYDAAGAVTVTGNQSATADITPAGSQTDGYTVLIAPKAAGEPLMTLQAGGKPLTVKTNAAIESGQSYTFNLKVGKDHVVLKDISIGKWEEPIAQAGNTTNVALPEVTDAQAGIFIHYADGDADNGENLKLGAGTGTQRIEHVWKSKESNPHIVIYSPYNENAAYNGNIALAYGTDYCYASINADGTQTVSELLSSGNTLTVGDAYRHIMGKLTLVFKDSNGITITPAAVKLNNFYKNGTLNLQSGNVSTTGKRTEAINVTESGWDNLLVIPQNIPRFADMVSITHGDKKYIYTPQESDVSITGGEHITLTLTLPATTSTTRAAGEAPLRMQGVITLNKERR